ncbi:YqgE/AlgH family protein [Nocardioides campestrisoli]|uniref:YqgE/AlgH family protein n=1 Tax=Nocardioides campestrisoli TaxID=2736757 RepID=UPI0015E6416F|nr:YqgE/AlgH family protein [Nocardioides campestrisoli]
MGDAEQDAERERTVRAGSLLVATPGMTDPNFADTVVLMLDVDADGALGVVLNRPSPVLVSEVLGEWGEVATEPEVLFHGGPVGVEGALAVAQLADPADEPVGFRAVWVNQGTVLGIVDLDAPLELVSGSLSGLRVFAGYAGWGAQQLRGEVARGDWYVVPGDERDVFRVDPETLRRDVLRRQPGELAWHSTRPDDPALN